MDQNIVVEQVEVEQQAEVAVVELSLEQLANVGGGAIIFVD